MFRYLVILPFLSNAAFAAGFDCAKAFLPVENIICNDKRLANLDDELNSQYRDLSMLLKEKGKSHLREMQHLWLESRNAMSDKFYVRLSYQRQIRRLKYLRNNINGLLGISNSDAKNVFLLLISEKLPAPHSVQIFSSSIYLLGISDTGRVGQGLYAANIEKNIIRKILGGLGGTIHFSTETVPVNIFKTTTLNRGRMNSRIGVMYKDDSDLGINSEVIASFLEDGESGGCGRGPSIGINKSSQMLDYSFKGKIPNLLLEIRIKETDCLTGLSVEKVVSYLFDNNGYTKI